MWVGTPTSASTPSENCRASPLCLNCQCEKGRCGMHSFLPSLLSLFLYLIPPRSSLAALAAIVSNAPLPSSLLCVSLQERVSQQGPSLFSVSLQKCLRAPFLKRQPRLHSTVARPSVEPHRPLHALNVLLPSHLLSVSAGHSVVNWNVMELRS